MCTSGGYTLCRVGGCYSLRSLSQPKTALRFIKGLHNRYVNHSIEKQLERLTIQRIFCVVLVFGISHVLYAERSGYAGPEMHGNQSETSRSKTNNFVIRNTMDLGSRLNRFRIR